MLVPASSTAASFPGQNGSIVYQAGGDIFLNELNGEEPINLTDHPAMDLNPQWSPRGTELLFNSDREGSDDIWMLHMPSRAVTKVFGTGALEFAPTWCGSDMFAFMSNATGNFEIYVAPVGDGDESEPPQNISNSPLFDGYPECSVNGLLAFTRSSSPTNGDIYVGDWGGNEPPVPVVSAPGYQGFPSWYPDGSALVYVDSSGESSDVRRVNVDGSEDVGLMTGPDNEWDPIISPDGKVLALGIGTLGGDDIYTVDLVSLDTPVPLTTDGASYSPDWQPVGDDTVYRHERKVSLRQVDGKPLKLRGRVTVEDKFDECIRQVKAKVLIRTQKKKKIKRTVETNDQGRFALTVEKLGAQPVSARARVPAFLTQDELPTPLTHMCVFDESAFITLSPP